MANINITTLIEVLPDSVKADVEYFTEGQITHNGKRVSVLRVTLDRLLTDDEKTEMAHCRKIFGITGICEYRYAPEIRHSYFYVKM